MQAVDAYRVTHYCLPISFKGVKKHMATPEVIKKFYKNSKAWKAARIECILRCHGLCQTCGRTGKEVHHKIPLTLANLDNPLIALGQDNLELLCTSCHDKERRKHEPIRSDVMFDEMGNLIKK